MLTDNEQQELQGISEHGRKAQIVQEFVKDFLLEQRADTINALETKSFNDVRELVQAVDYLRTLRIFELNIEKYISLGEIAQRRLNEDGD